jgi:2-haloacid dehalogenase
LSPRWLETIPGPIPGTPALVAALAARGVAQYAITNFGADTWAMFRPTFPVLAPMIDIVVSGVERLTKPDPAIFQLAAQRFGRVPERMLFIDDNHANIASAAALGCPWWTRRTKHSPSMRGTPAAQWKKMPTASPSPKTPK